MYSTRTSSQTRGVYTAKTLTMSASNIAAERARREEAELDWGTMDQAPQRVAAPTGSSWVDMGVALALVGMLGGATLLAGGTILAAGALVLMQPGSEMAMANLGGLQGNEPVEVAAVPATAAPVVAATAPAEEPAATKAAPVAKKKSPAQRRSRRARTAPSRKAALPTSAPTTPQDGESAMSLSQLKSYLGQGEAPAAAPSRPAPAPAAAPVESTGDSELDAIIAARPTPAAAPAAAPSKPDVDAELEAILNEPAPSLDTAPAAAPVRQAPAPRPQGTNGVKQLSARLAKAPNGVLILDEPFDPVPVAFATDGGAAIYIDGELLGGAPLAVVLDRGSHEVTVQAEKGTATFEVDATEGQKYCFSVKRSPKMGTCR